MPRKRNPSVASRSNRGASGSPFSLLGDERVTYHIGGHGEHQPDTLPDAPDLTLPFAEIIERARLYVHMQFGSFEKFAEYGLIA